MCGWWKNKSNEIVRNVVRKHIVLSTEFIINVGNEMTQEFIKNGHSAAGMDMNRIITRCNLLTSDIFKGIGAGMSMEEMENELIRPTINRNKPEEFALNRIEQVIINVKRRLSIK